MLSITLFGSARFELQMPGKMQSLHLSPRCAELLAFLGVHRGQSFTRSDLIEAIWSEQVTETAIGSINTTLWRLRKGLEALNVPIGVYLATDRRGVGLSSGAQIEVDVVRFESRARTELAKTAARAGEADREALRVVALLYRERPLAGFSGTWALRCRETLRTIYLDILEHLMAWHAQNAEYALAIGYARRILDVDPLREDVHGALMRYFALNGQRTLALRQFESCRALLQRELAIPPLPEIVALYREIARDSLRAHVTLPSVTNVPAERGIQAPRQAPHASIEGPSRTRELQNLRDKMAELDLSLRALESRFPLEAEPGKPEAR
jgi:DNA-binding SARP family transcriptional activator